MWVIIQDPHFLFYRKEVFRMMLKKPSKKSLILNASFKLNQIKEYWVPNGYHQALDIAIEALRFQQELVRCKDCGYAYQGLDHYFCHKHNTYKKQGGFCDDGILEEVDGE